LNGLGAAELLDGRARSALEHFDRALRLDPENAEARQNSAAARRALGDARGADEDEARAMTLFARAGDAASLANLHGLRGQRFLAEGRLGEASSEFREAARLEPEQARAHLGIGAVLAAEASAEPDERLRSALVDRAIEAFERALAIDPDEPTAHMNLGITYLRQRPDPKKAARHLRAYLRLVPDAPQRAQMEDTIRRIDELP
jgi:Flp pilus assembly protein TadD